MKHCAFTQGWLPLLFKQGPRQQMGWRLKGPGVSSNDRVSCRWLFLCFTCNESLTSNELKIMHWHFSHSWIIWIIEVLIRQVEKAGGWSSRCLKHHSFHKQSTFHLLKKSHTRVFFSPHTGFSHVMTLDWTCVIMRNVLSREKRIRPRTNLTWTTNNANIKMQKSSGNKWLVETSCVYLWNVLNSVLITFWNKCIEEKKIT